MGWLALLLLLTGLSALWRVTRGPSMPDRLLGIQMLGTTGIAFLLVLAVWRQDDTWRYVALVLALLAAVITVALVQLLRPKEHK
jgi:multicomponent Na+:H+ antiporter subunit F